MRISDWSSDVCSSDLFGPDGLLGPEVGGGDEVRGPLSRDLELLDLAEVAHETAARLLGGPGHDVDEGGTDGHDPGISPSRARNRWRRPCSRRRGCRPRCAAGP